MMDITEYKRVGKANFNRETGSMIFVTFILSLVEGGGMSFNFNSINSETNSDFEAFAIIAVTVLVAVCSIISLAVSILVKPVILTGCCKCLINNSCGHKINLNDIFSYFNKENYKNVVIVHLMKSLVEFLYTLCFIVPGIVKSYEYFCVPYLVALNPNMNESEIRELSLNLMCGHKWDLFMLRLSFIGWHLLSILTCGILEIVYVSPYLKASEAAFFNSVYMEKCVVHCDQTAEQTSIIK